MPDLPFSRIRVRMLPAMIYPFMVLALVCLLLCIPVAAHAPSAMTLAFDPTAGQLSVTITHAVPNPTNHYIRDVEIRVNNVIITDQEYSGQPSKDTFTYSYPVNARPGDTIRITATCVLVGRAQREYTVPEPALSPAATGTGLTTAGPSVTAVQQPTAPAPAPTAAPAGLLPLLGAALVLLLRKK